MELQYSGRASPSTMEEEDLLEREREATKGKGKKSPISPTIYRRANGGAALGDLISKGGAAKGEESLLPQAPRRCLPLLGLFPP